MSADQIILSGIISILFEDLQVTVRSVSKASDVKICNVNMKFTVISRLRTTSRSTSKAREKKSNHNLHLIVDHVYVVLLDDLIDRFIDDSRLNYLIVCLVHRADSDSEMTLLIDSKNSINDLKSDVRIGGDIHEYKMMTVFLEIYRGTGNSKTDDKNLNDILKIVEFVNCDVSLT